MRNTTILPQQIKKKTCLQLHEEYNSDDEYSTYLSITICCIVFQFAWITVECN